MLAAPSNLSVPRSREIRNTREISITQALLRCEARMAVVTDTRLSPGARLLYVLLDDYAGLNGTCWPHQRTLAAQLGVSERHAKRWVAELVAAGLVEASRSREGNRYRVAWKGTPAPVCGDADVPTVGTPVSPARARVEEFIEPENEPACPRCRDTGWLGDRERLCDCSEGRAIEKRLRERMR